MQHLKIVFLKLFQHEASDCGEVIQLSVSCCTSQIDNSNLLYKKFQIVFIIYFHLWVIQLPADFCIHFCWEVSLSACTHTNSYQTKLNSTFILKPKFSAPYILNCIQDLVGICTSQLYYEVDDTISWKCWIYNVCCYFASVQQVELTSVINAILWMLRVPFVLKIKDCVSRPKLYVAHTL